MDYAGKDIYINANLVEVPEAEREYILTQGGLELLSLLTFYIYNCPQVRLRRQWMISG